MSKEELEDFMAGLFGNESGTIGDIDTGGSTGGTGDGGGMNLE